MPSTYQTLQSLLYSGQGVGVLFVWVLRQWRSMQNCRPPSFFLTNTTTLYHTLWLGLIVPDSSISHRWFWTSSTRDRGICLTHKDKGVSSVTFIMCSVEWVQPNSMGFNENTLWYSARSQWVVLTSSGGQESYPLQSSSSNSFPCLCQTVNFRVWQSWGSSPSFCNWSSLGGSGTRNAATALATRVFFWRVCG